MKITTEEFRNIAIECNFDHIAMSNKLQTLYPSMQQKPSRVLARLETLRRGGLLPLDSGNSVSAGEVLKGSSTLYDEQGNVKLQWVKTDVPRQNQLDAFTEAVDNITARINQPTTVLVPDIANEMSDLLSIYTIGDAHIGLLAWGPESGEDNDLLIAEARHIKAMELLVAQSRPTQEAFIVDVGDFFHSDNTKNRTAASGHSLDVDGRYAKVLELGLYLTTKLIDLALAKHETVHWRSAIGELIAT